MVKTAAATTPVLIATEIGLLWEGRARLFTLVGALLSVVTTSEADRWFKSKENQAEEERDQADALASARGSVSIASSGALVEAVSTIAEAMRVIHEASRTGQRCRESLNDGREELAHVLGGGNAIPKKARETYDLNGKACQSLDDMGHALESAIAELRCFLPALS